MLALKKAFSWFKHYWLIPISGLLIFMFFMLKKQNGPNLKSAIKTAKNAHEKELKVINSAHEKELQDRATAFKQFEATTRKVEEAYKNDNKLYDKKKRKLVNNIIKKFKDNPEALASELENETGYDITIVNE